MKPWVNPDKSGLSSFRSGTFGANICPWECRPSSGLNECVGCDYPRACALGYAGVPPHKRTSETCPFGDRPAVSKGLSALGKSKRRGNRRYGENDRERLAKIASALVEKGLLKQL